MGGVLLLPPHPRSLRQEGAGGQGAPPLPGRGRISPWKRSKNGVFFNLTPNLPPTQGVNTSKLRSGRELSPPPPPPPSLRCTGIFGAR